MLIFYALNNKESIHRQTVQDPLPHPYLVVAAYPKGYFMEDETYKERYFKYDLQNKSYTEISNINAPISSKDDSDLIEDIDIRSRNKTTCVGDIIDWDRNRKRVLTLSKTQSLVDSSSDDVSGVCVYDYQNNRQDFFIPIPHTKSQYYTTGWGGLIIGKVVLTGGSSLLLVDIRTKKVKLIPDVYLLSDSENLIREGLLLVVAKEKSVQEVRVFDLHTETYRSIVSIDRNAFLDNTIEYLRYRQISDKPEGRYVLEYTNYNPYEVCWYWFEVDGSTGKLLCSRDVHTAIFQDVEINNFRVDLNGYVE